MISVFTVGVDVVMPPTIISSNIKLPSNSLTNYRVKFILQGYKGISLFGKVYNMLEKGLSMEQVYNSIAWYC